MANWSLIRLPAMIVLSGSYCLFRNTLIALEYLHADPETDPDSDTLTA